MAIHIQGVSKKCPIAILSLNLYQRSDYTFSHVFRNQNFDSVPSLNIPIQNINRSKTLVLNRAWWALKWRRDNGWNTLKHISCFEEEMTQFSVHFQLWSHITKHRTKQRDLWKALPVSTDWVRHARAKTTQHNLHKKWPGKMRSRHAFLVFLGHLIFWMDMFKVFRWKGSKFWFWNTCEKYNWTSGTNYS